MVGANQKHPPPPPKERKRQNKNTLIFPFFVPLRSEKFIPNGKNILARVQRKKGKK